MAPTIATVLLASAAAVAINLATEWKTNLWAWLVVGVITVLAAAVAVWLDRRQSQPPRDLAGIADFLAIVICDQWQKEAMWRRLYDPYAMPVRWGPSDLSLVTDWLSLVRLAATFPGRSAPSAGTWAADPIELTGGGNDLVEVLNKVPTRRLVVLGEPGAGKTSLLVRLVLDLFSRRNSGEAVPILLSLASWNPAEQDLRSWIVQMLITGDSALAEPAPDGMNVSRAQALLDNGLIFPVLDGLDEIPDAVRGFAIARINDAMRPNQPLVLAARTAPYRAAVRPPEGVEVQLTGAASITLCPLDTSIVSDYLKASAGGSGRWDEVLRILVADRASPIAQALKTPLMVALARAIYNPQPGETLATIPQPAELLRFPTCGAIEQHLFDGFIPAAYRPRPDQSQLCKWTTSQATRWLVFLASNLEDRRTTDFAWWELSSAVPRSLAGIVVGLVAGFVAALGFPFPMDFGIGLLSAVFAGLLVRRWVKFDRRGLARGLVGGLSGGLVGALGGLAVFGSGIKGTFVAIFFAGALGFGIAVAPLGGFVAGFAGAFAGVFVAAFSRHGAIVHEIGLTLGPIAWLINGLGVGLAAGLAVGLSDHRSAPARQLRWSPIGFVCGLTCGLVAGFILWIQIGSSAGIIVGLVSAIVGGYAGSLFEAASADFTRAVGPKTVLVRDRATFRSSCLGLGLAIGLSTGLSTALSPNLISGASNGFLVGLVVGLANLIMVGLSFGFLRASWGSFTLARWWLAASRQLPWRLMTFLADAHERRGVLRQAGAFYQFRHAELQRHLANNQ